MKLTTFKFLGFLFIIFGASWPVVADAGVHSDPYIACLNVIKDTSLSEVGFKDHFPEHNTYRMDEGILSNTIDEEISGEVIIHAPHATVTFNTETSNCTVDRKKIDWANKVSELLDYRIGEVERAKSNKADYIKAMRIIIKECRRIPELESTLDSIQSRLNVVAGTYENRSLLQKFITH